MTVSGRTIASALHGFGKPADPAKHQPVRGNEWQSSWFTPAQYSDLLPKHEDFCFQRCSWPKQINHEAKDQSDEIQHLA